MLITMKLFRLTQPSYNWVHLEKPIQTLYGGVATA